MIPPIIPGHTDSELPAIHEEIRALDLAHRAALVARIGSLLVAGNAEGFTFRLELREPQDPDFGPDADVTGILRFIANINDPSRIEPGERAALRQLLSPDASPMISGSTSGSGQVLETLDIPGAVPSTHQMMEVAHLFRVPPASGSQIAQAAINRLASLQFYRLFALDASSKEGQ